MTILYGDKLVHRAELWAAARGRWTLEIAYTDDVIPSGRVTVTWGSAAFVGTIDPSHVGYFNGEIIAKIVGGWGWSNELPSAWYQSDNPGVNGRTIATKAAEAVGETLYAATDTGKPATNLFRPMRVSYSRAKQTAGSVLEDVLAPGASWWTDFEGTTRVGVRVAPLPAARVVLLDYDPASKWAELDADDPASLIGATIPADPIRGTPALVINELFAWASDEGFRYRAAVAPSSANESSRLAAALRDVVRAFVPELPALELRRARVVAQASDGRVSVQQVDRAGEIADFGRTEGAVRFYPGIPGASCDLQIASTETLAQSNPEVVLAFSRADWSDPIAFLAAPVGQPGHVPLVTRLEAVNTIKLVSASTGKVQVGATPTSPVALAGPLKTYIDKLEAYLTTFVDPPFIAAAAPVPVPEIVDRIAAAALVDSNAAATKLEAK